MRIVLVVMSLMTSFSMSAQNMPPKSGIHLFEGSFKNGDSYTYEGNFERHLFHGNGVFKTEDIVADGTFENNSFKSGTIIITRTNSVQKSTGTFEVRENQSFPPRLLQGVEVTTTDLGVITTCHYEKGVLINNCQSNNENNYNSDDLSGSKKTTIGLHYFSNEYHLPIGFGTETIHIKWDTGAYGLIINTEDFIKIKALCDLEPNDGLNIKSTGIQQQSMFAGGNSSLGEVWILDGVNIGGMTVNNLIMIYDPGCMHSLLGMNFFDKFSNVTWDMSDKQMVLFK